jgi:hypothetical protein
MVNMDNPTVVAYIIHHGGLVSKTLYQETEKLLLLAETREWTLISKQIPGHMNILASQVGIRHCTHYWTLNQCVVNQLFSRRGWPNVDLFATSLTKGLPLYVSLVQDPQAWQVYALSISWDSLHHTPAQQPRGLILVDNKCLIHETIIDPNIYFLVFCKNIKFQADLHHLSKITEGNHFNRTLRFNLHLSHKDQIKATTCPWNTNSKYP